MRFKGPELIVDAAVAKLQTYLPARIATINSEHTDFTVDTPDNGRYYTAAKRLYPPGPCVVVFDGRIGRAPGTVSEGPHQVMTETLLGVYVIADDSDEERLDRKLKRLNAAAIEALLDDTPKEKLADASDSTSTVAWRIAFRESTPSPVFHPDGDGPLLRASRVTIFTVTRLEQ